MRRPILAAAATLMACTPERPPTPILATATATATATASASPSASATASASASPSASASAPAPATAPASASASATASASPSASPSPCSPSSPPPTSATARCGAGCAFRACVAVEVTGDRTCEWHCTWTERSGAGTLRATEGFFDATGTRSIGRFVVHDGPAPAKADDWNDRLEIVPNAGALPWVMITRDKKCLALPARATPCRIERFAWNGTTLAPLL